MHEVAICQSIINTVEEQFSSEQLEQIREVHLKMGVLSCTEPSIVLQLYGMMIANTELQHSELKITRAEIVAVCDKCGQKINVKNYVFICPSCNKPLTNIIEGNELQIHKIILEEFSYEETNQ